MTAPQKTIQDPQNHAEELRSHLEKLGIDCEVTRAGNVSIRDSQALLKHLTDADFIGRKTVATKPMKGPAVPVHQTQNPVGALQEWCARAKIKLPVYVIKDIGAVHSPLYSCQVAVEKEGVLCESATYVNKAGAKHRAAMLMLEALALLYGAERS